MTNAATPDLFELVNHEVEKQLDDDRRDIIEAVDETRAEHEEGKVCGTIKNIARRVSGTITGNEITEANRSERDETVIECINIRPLFARMVQSRGATGSD